MVDEKREQNHQVPYKRYSLLTTKHQLGLSALVAARDLNNNWMSHKEVITGIMQISAAPSFAVATDHYNYMMKRNLLPDCKNNVIMVQKTTTKRCQITVAQQMHWHMLIESVWKEQASLNLPAAEFTEVKAHFIPNIDETCIMASDRAVTIVGSKANKVTYIILYFKLLFSFFTKILH